MPRTHLGIRLLTVSLLMVTMAACSSDSDEPDADDTDRPEQPTSSLLEDITDQEMCDLLDDEAIEQAIENPVAGGDGRRTGKMPLFLAVTCNYDVDGLPSLSTELSTTEADQTDQEILDKAFTSIAGEDLPVVDYDDVPDLGSLAGFGADAMLSSADVNGWRLAVVFTVEDERLLLTLATLGQVELDQLQPLAEQLIAGLESRG